MKAMITIMLMVGVVGIAAAYDLGNQAPVKPVVTYPENIPTPERQGGDTIALAQVILSLPYTDNGTTVGYTDDYDAVSRTRARPLPTSSTSTSPRQACRWISISAVRPSIRNSTSLTPHWISSPATTTSTSALPAASTSPRWKT